MGLWLLSFTGRCNAAVVRAESLIQARLLAVADGIVRARLTSTKASRSIPSTRARSRRGLIGRQLSGGEAADLLTMLMIASPDSWHRRVHRRGWSRAGRERPKKSDPQPEYSGPVRSPRRSLELSKHFR
jgi:hypothetical protein